MTRFILPLLALLACSAPAWAEPVVVEQETIRLDGDPSQARDKAMAQAQRRVVERLAGRRVTQAEIDNAVTYTDVTAEQISGTRYEASFSIAVDQGRLLGSRPAAPVAAAGGPRWVLLIPARIMPRGVEVWNLDDPWTMVWRREMMPGAIPIGAATGDAEDLDLLSQAQAHNRDAEALRRLARKYGAGAAALAVIDEAGVFAADPNAAASEDVQIETLYVPVEGAPVHVMVGLTKVADGGVRGVAQQLAGVIRKLAGESASGVTMGSPPQYLVPPGQPAQAAPLWSGQGGFVPPSVTVGGGIGTPGGTMFQGANGQAAHFIRVRVRGAAEWQMIANKLASIPGASFTPVGAPTGWLQGYVGYAGGADALRRELIQRGIPAE